MDKPWSIVCPKCGGSGGMHFVEGETGWQEPCPTCKGSGRVALGVECCKCYGTGTREARSNGYANPNKRCDCMKGIRPLSEQEVEELIYSINQRDFGPASEETQRGIAIGIILHSKDMTFKGNPVKIIPWEEKA